MGARRCVYVCVFGPNGFPEKRAVKQNCFLVTVTVKYSTAFKDTMPHLPPSQWTIIRERNAGKHYYNVSIHSDVGYFPKYFMWDGIKIGSALTLRETITPICAPTFICSSNFLALLPFLGVIWLPGYINTSSHIKSQKPQMYGKNNHVMSGFFHISATR